jgi:hypothetical protein
VHLCIPTYLPTFHVCVHRELDDCTHESYRKKPTVLLCDTFYIPPFLPLSPPHAVTIQGGVEAYLIHKHEDVHDMKMKHKVPLKIFLAAFELTCLLAKVQMIRETGIPDGNSVLSDRETRVIIAMFVPVVLFGFALCVTTVDAENFLRTGFVSWIAMVLILWSNNWFSRFVLSAKFYLWLGLVVSIVITRAVWFILADVILVGCVWCWKSVSSCFGKLQKKWSNAI